MYLAELWKVANTCDWTNAQLTKNLWDKFVIGLCNEHLLQQLLTEDHKKPLDDLFQLATTVEAAEKKSFRWAEDSSESNTAVSSVTPFLKEDNSAAKSKKAPSTVKGSNAMCKLWWKSFLCTCRFRNAKCGRCHKVGHIQKVWHSSTTVVQSGHSIDLVVVTVSPSLEIDDIPPMFQILQLHKFTRQLRLVVDSASPVTFVNSRTWKDLDKPKFQPTSKVLGSFEG